MVVVVSMEFLRIAHLTTTTNSKRIVLKNYELQPNIAIKIEQNIPKIAFQTSLSISQQQKLIKQILVK